MISVNPKTSGGIPTIKVAEHVVLFKFNDGFTVEQEMDMYKSLWTFEGRYSSILTMSLGKILEKNADEVTHALVMRFASQESLDVYRADQYRIDVSRKYINPFLSRKLTADFYTDVDTDLNQLFRDSEGFKGGVEHIELFKIKDCTPETKVEEFLDALIELPNIVQANMLQVTTGANFRPRQKYTHALLLRLPTVEDLAVLREDPKYIQSFDTIRPILDGHLRVDFLVNESKKRIDEESST